MYRRASSLHVTLDSECNLLNANKKRIHTQNQTPDLFLGGYQNLGIDGDNFFLGRGHTERWEKHKKEDYYVCVCMEVVKIDEPKT